MVEGSNPSRPTIQTGPYRLQAHDYGSSDQSHNPVLLLHLLVFPVVVRAHVFIGQVKGRADTSEAVINHSVCNPPLES